MTREDLVSVHTPDKVAVAHLVRDATTAPSMHNAQPWRFRYARGSRTFSLFADLTRAMPHADPTTRGLHIGCGAALFNLRVAAAHARLRPVTRLLPDAAAPDLLATVRLDAPEGPADGLTVLHPAIHDRHTSRYPFTGRRVPAEVRHALTEAAQREEAELTFPAGSHLRTVLDLIRDAEGYDHMDVRREAETERWTRDTTAEAPVDGIPEYAFGPLKRGGSAPVRDFAGRTPAHGRALADFEDRPQLALLRTAGDGPADWLRAGQALERVLLIATLHGLSTSFATQALEWPELRWILRDPDSGRGHVQMVIRLGYGPAGAKTPRRPVSHVLVVED
ncbi:MULTISPECIES: Acg family FMN-binding oxidoreductase [unclassified Streptomyces]|uniref:Acg family FMN-binding oxidoreductase n=1 Tax=unclassified Streptomyces TaxID=2593676 RepID=UPI002E77A57B|nr:nitroreductase [Streptomyces sp. JV176]MEE1803504.1 nitroreductase [Streptomyces sp. JV176]